MTRESGVTMGENSNRKRDATPFELWASLFAGDCSLLLNSRDDLITGSNQIFVHIFKVGLQMHIGRSAKAFKAEAIDFPPPRQAFKAADTPRFLVDSTGFVKLSENFKHLGSITFYSPISDADVSMRIKSATAAFEALKKHYGDKYLSEKDKDECTRNSPCPLCSIAAKSRPFEMIVSATSALQNRCARGMCRISIAHTIRQSITSESLFCRLGILDLGIYYLNQVLRWAGHVASMPMIRAPRQLLTG
jgi:hypothetical protein